MGLLNGRSDLRIRPDSPGLCRMTVDLLVWFCGTNELSLNQKSLVFWFFLKLFEVQNPNFE